MIPPWSVALSSFIESGNISIILKITIKTRLPWCTGFSSSPRASPGPPLGPDILDVLAKVFSPLLIVVFVATGRHLVWGSLSN